jgi:hypothetical protein
MGGVSLETCSAIKKHWNNKFYYTVASCWYFLFDLYVLELMTIVPRNMERGSQSERNLNRLKCLVYNELVGQRLTDLGCRIASATKFWAWLLIFSE